MVINSGNSFARQNGTKHKSEDKIIFSFNRNKRSKVFLYTITVATIMVKHLNSARNLEFKETHDMYY